MNKILEKDIPANILKFIDLQTAWLIRTRNFSPQDRDDIKQDLILFYLEKFLYASQKPSADGFLFISIKNEARCLLRSKLRNNFYMRKNELNVMALQEEAFDDDRLENMEMVEKIFRTLSKTEQDIFLMIMGDATLGEIAQKLKVSKNTIYKILERTKEVFKK